jgi:hypothetical protein
MGAWGTGLMATSLVRRPPPVSPVGPLRGESPPLNFTALIFGRPLWRPTLEQRAAHQRQVRFFLQNPALNLRFTADGLRLAALIDLDLLNLTIADNRVRLNTQL